MAKIVIAGDAVVITSAIKLEDLRTIQKHRPTALILKGGEDGNEPIFAINVTNGNGDINQYGASFGSATRDDAKLATITLVAPGIDGDIKEFVADKLGSALINLNKLEESLPDVVQSITAERAKVMESIVDVTNGTGDANQSDAQ